MWNGISQVGAGFPLFIYSLILAYTKEAGRGQRWENLMQRAEMQRSKTSFSLHTFPTTAGLRLTFWRGGKNHRPAALPAQQPQPQQAGFLLEVSSRKMIGDGATLTSLSSALSVSILVISCHYQKCSFFLVSKQLLGQPHWPSYLLSLLKWSYSARFHPRCSSLLPPRAHSHE